MGRPTVYSEAMCEVVEAELAQGKSLTAAVAVLGIHRDTAYEWMDLHPAFSDAVKRGRAQGVALWEARLANQAMDNRGNTAAIIFAMKNLYRDDWNDRTAVEHTSPDGSMTPQPTRIELVAPHDDGRAA